MPAAPTTTANRNQNRLKSPTRLRDEALIVWLYRGQGDRFVSLVARHLESAAQAANAALEPLDRFVKSLDEAREEISTFFKGRKHEAKVEFEKTVTALEKDAVTLGKGGAKSTKTWKASKRDNASLKTTAGAIKDVAEQAHNMAKRIEHAYRLLARLVELAENDFNARDDENWDGRAVRAATKVLEEHRVEATEALNLVRYFVRHARWLQDRFPHAKLREVEGLVKLVAFKTLESHDWSLTPGRYVGVAPQEEDEDFDFEESMNTIHSELADLNTEASDLATVISKNFEALEI
jgi:type I restriction enzyme M protein